MDRYTPLPPHAVPEEAKAYVAAMTQKERELHDLAVELLGSSYFVEWSHGFKKWRATTVAAAEAQGAAKKATAANPAQ